MGIRPVSCSAPPFELRQSTNSRNRLVRVGHLLEIGMSRKGVLTAIVVCLLLALVGGGILGWMWISRDRAAVATYRVQSLPGESMVAIIAKETEMMKSEEVLKPVISNLDLVSRWKLDSDLEALARLRSKLTVKQDGNRVRVIYRDRSQDRALEILKAINEGFAKVRNAATVRQTMPPVIPLDAPNP